VEWSEYIVRLFPSKADPCTGRWSTYPSVRAHQPISSSMSNRECCILEQNLSSCTDTKIGDVDVKRVFPLRILFIESRLRTSELCSFLGGLCRHFFVFRFSFDGSLLLKQLFTLFVAQLFPVLSMKQLRSQKFTTIFKWESLLSS